MPFCHFNLTFYQKKTSIFILCTFLQNTMSSPNLLYNHAGRFLSKKRNHTRKPIAINENTQTSKTILQLADFELQNAIKVHKNPHSMADEIGDYDTRKLRFDRKNNVIAASTVQDKQNDHSYKNSKIFENKDNFVRWDGEGPAAVAGQKGKNKSCIISPGKWSRFSVKEIRIKSFNVDEPEGREKSSSSLNDLGNNGEQSASGKSQYEGRTSDESSESFTTATTIDSRRRARSLSPPPTHRSYDETFTTNATVEEDDDISTMKTNDSAKSKDNRFNVMMLQVKSSNWNISLKAMSEIAEILENIEYERLYSSMPELNQRLIAFLRSPRSHVCRTACQIAGRFFAIVKDTRRPEFDAIVDLLLLRTADANKFIRNDANLALDTLIIHIPPFHTIRVISQKAPSHKNDLVRITSARLMVCIVGLAGADLFLSPPANEASRKRLIQLMAKFVLDKNGKTREYGARLYVALYKHPHFELHLKKIVNKPSINEMKKIMKNVNFE